MESFNTEQIEAGKAMAREWGRIGGNKRKESLGKKGYKAMGKAGAEKRWGTLSTSKFDKNGSPML